MISNLYNTGKRLFLGGLLLYQLGCDGNKYNECPVESQRGKKVAVKSQPSKTKKKETKFGSLEQKASKVNYELLEKKIFSKLDKRLQSRLDSLYVLTGKNYSNILRELKGLYKNINDINFYNKTIENRLNILLDLYESRMGPYKKSESKLDSTMIPFSSAQADTSMKPFEEEQKQKSIDKDSLNIFSSDTIKAEPRKTALEAAIGYDSDNLYTGELRYGSNFRYGLVLGFSTKEVRNVTTPIINNFYGEGSDVISKLFIGASLGFDLGKYVTLNAVLGLNIEDEQVVESIKRSDGQVLSSNTDKYSNQRIRGYTGLDINLNEFSIGPRLVYDDNKFYSGLMARYRF